MVVKNSGLNASIQASIPRSGNDCTRPRATNVSRSRPTGTGAKSTSIVPLPEIPT